MLKIYQIKHFITSLFLFALPMLTYAISESDSQMIFDQLTNLNLRELGEVEVTLADVFNIFDAIVAVKETSVATGTNQSTSRAPAITSVITAQDIEAMGAIDLDEILETVPGLHVARLDFTYMPIYSFRGIYTERNPHALLLINNIPMTSLVGGNRGFIWGGMPVNAIKQIEIVRGPGSAVFGADAFAGVINIITKNKNDIDGTEVGVRYGSFNTYNAHLLHGAEWQGFDVAFALEYHDTEGHKQLVEADIQTAYDNIYGTEASLAPGPVNLQRNNLDVRLDIAREHWQLRAGYQGRHNVGTGAGIVGALNPNLHSEDRINADLTYHNPKLTKNWNVMAKISFLNTHWDLPSNSWQLPPGTFGGAYPKGILNNFTISEHHTRLNLSGFYTGFNKHTLRLGIGYYYGDLYKSTEQKNTGINPTTGLPIPTTSDVVDFTDTPNISMPERARNNWHIFIQDTWAFASNWELTTGIRYDEYSDFGTTTNPRLALVWQINAHSFSKLIYGHAFRSPAFLDLYSNNLLLPGNPNLKPETIDTLEFAYDYTVTSNLHLALNLFAYKWHDVVSFSYNENSWLNMGKQTGSGFEIETRWLVTKNFSILANYAYQHALNENDHNPAPAPHQTSYLRTDWLVYPNWYLNTQVNWVAKRKRRFADPRAAIDDYTTVDLTLRRKSIRQNNWNFAIGIRNLFAADARSPFYGHDSNNNSIVAIPNDLPLAGRHYFMELRYRF